MFAIPSPRPSPRIEPLSFTIGARADLRIGALAAGVVKLRTPVEDAFQFSNLCRLLRAARMAWRERGALAGLTLVVPPSVQAELEAELLSEAAVEAGCTRKSLNFQLNEREIVTAGPALAEGLRERGWSVVLRGDPDCPIPFGARARALYSELVVDAPETLDPFLPFLAMEADDPTPLGRRLLAAKRAGLIITADAVATAPQATLLAVAGFDRGGGPFAEAGLR